MYELRFLNCNCKGGGGGISGAVSWPLYLEQIHEDWLDLAVTGPKATIETSVTDVMNDALGASPFSGANAYDPTTPIAAMDLSIVNLSSMATGMDYQVEWASIMSLIDSNPSIAAEIAAFEAEVDANISNVILPRFQRGMQNINAVYSSSFVLGEALIESQATIQKARFASELRKAFIFNGLASLIDMWKFQYEYYRVVEHYSLEKDRMKIVALKEQRDQDIQLDESDAKWDLEVFAHGANVMAGISGGTTHSQGQKASRAASAIGGALSGASVGYAAGAAYGSYVAASAATSAAAGASSGAATGAASTGPYAPIGAAVGAIIGGIGAYLAS
jgi:hypothetical protein